LMVVVTLLTPAPSARTLERYFPADAIRSRQSAIRIP
jgi:hypothetical protein